MATLAESRARTELRALLTAVQYFTRLPVPGWVGHSEAQLNGAARYFPLVGLLIGASCGLVLWVCSLALPQPLPALLATAVGLCLTGAFHEDGLADTFDGLGGSLQRDRALAIMKDSRIGTFGALALLIVVGAKIAALAAAPPAPAAFALCCAHPLSRACALVFIWRSSYAGDLEHSRAKPMSSAISTRAFLFAACLAAIPSLAVGPSAWVGACAALIALCAMWRWIHRRLGGYTGDTLGAAQQICEVAFYLGFAAWPSG